MEENLKQIQKLLDAAEGNLQSARNLLRNTISGKTEPLDITNKIASLDPNAAVDAIQGIFDGESLVADEGKKYPVPPNYASKSKLVEGDTLKLNIADDGSFIFKQIEPIERKSLVGTLTKNEDGYLVNAEGKGYKVLTASITFYKAKIGDQVTILLPKDHDAVWAAMENVVTPGGSSDTSDNTPALEHIELPASDETISEPIEIIPAEEKPENKPDLGEKTIQPVSDPNEVSPTPLTDATLKEFTDPVAPTFVAPVEPEPVATSSAAENPIPEIELVQTPENVEVPDSSGGPTIEFPSGDAELSDDQLLENLKNNLKNIQNPTFVTPQEVIAQPNKGITENNPSSLPNISTNSSSDQSISELEI